MVYHQSGNFSRRHNINHCFVDHPIQDVDFCCSQMFCDGIRTIYGCGTETLMFVKDSYSDVWSGYGQGGSRWLYFRNTRGSQ